MPLPSLFRGLPAVTPSRSTGRQISLLAPLRGGGVKCLCSPVKPARVYGRWLRGRSAVAGRRLLPATVNKALRSGRSAGFNRRFAVNSAPASGGTIRAPPRKRGAGAATSGLANAFLDAGWRGNERLCIAPNEPGSRARPASVGHARRLRGGRAARGQAALLLARFARAGRRVVGQRGVVMLEKK